MIFFGSTPEVSNFPTPPRACPPLSATYGQKARPGLVKANGALTLKRAGNDVDGEGEDAGIEEERQHTVSERQAAHAARRHLHVRYLAGHADDEAVVEEVPVIGRLLAGEEQ